jgi:hypothetical protein
VTCLRHVCCCCCFGALEGVGSCQSGGLELGLAELDAEFEFVAPDLGEVSLHEGVRHATRLRPAAILACPYLHLAGGAFARGNRTAVRLDLSDLVGGVVGGPSDDPVELGEVRWPYRRWLGRGGGRW